MWKDEEELCAQAAGSPRYLERQEVGQSETMLL